MPGRATPAALPSSLPGSAGWGMHGGPAKPDPTAAVHLAVEIRSSESPIARITGVI